MEHVEVNMYRVCATEDCIWDKHTLDSTCTKRSDFHRQRLILLPDDI